MATIATSSTTNNLGSAGTTTVVTKPSGTVDGDLLVAILGNRAATKTMSSVPSGWTLITSNTGATNKGMYAYWKIASSEPSDWTWTWGASGLNAGAVLRINGNFDPITPIDVSNAAATADGVTSLVFTDTVTPTKTNELMLFPVFASRAATGLDNISAYAVTNNNPSWTELYDINAGVSNSVVFSLAYATYSVASATGNSTATAGASAAGEGAEGMLIVILRQTAFTANIVDTETVADSITASRARVILNSDTETVTDSNSISKDAGWTNQNKNISTWTNQSKS